MSRSMIQAAVTMNQLQQKLDLIGNNLANSGTNGYKSQGADFASLLFQQMDNVGEPERNNNRLTPGGVRIGSGAKLGHTNRDTREGSLKTTDRNLDTALVHKNQLFQVQSMENGQPVTRYTRDGAFYLSPTADGQSVMLTTKDGDPVLGENGPIQFTGDVQDVDISQDGQVSVKRDNQTENIDQLAIVETEHPERLEATGDNKYRVSDVDGANVNDVIQQVDPEKRELENKALEQSNVDTGQEMTDMLRTQRAYQLNGKTITMDDQMMNLVNQLR